MAPAADVDAISEDAGNLQKKQFLCAQILHKHLFLLSCVQAEVIFRMFQFF